MENPGGSSNSNQHKDGFMSHDVQPETQLSPYGSLPAPNLSRRMTASPFLSRFALRFVRATAFFAVGLVAALFLTASDAQAQDMREVHFNEAVQIALENNTSIKRAENSLELQELTVKAEKAGFLPNLNLSTGA